MTEQQITEPEQDQEAGTRKHLSSIKALAPFVLCLVTIVLGSAQVRASDNTLLSAQEIERLRGLYHGDRPLGAVVFRCLDERSGLALDSLGSRIR